MLSNLITKIRNLVLSKTLLEFTASPDNRSLYFTFDDGPTPGVTDRLLDTLAKHNAKATFFVIGKKAERHPELMKRIVQEGHAIGNHSYTHPSFGKLSAAEQDTEIKRAHDAIAQNVGISTPLFRVPRGRWSLPMLFRLRKSGTRCIHWSTDSMDYDESDAAHIAQRILRNGAKPGEILLFHDDSPLCLDIMDRLLPKLAAKGFSLPAMDYKK